MSILKTLGLDALMYLGPQGSGFSKIITMAKVRKELAEIDAKHLKVAVKYAQNHLQRVNDDDNTINSKAFVLFSATGISATFLLGFSDFLSRLNNELPEWIGLCSFLVLLISYVLTIFFALRVIVTRYYSQPSIKDLKLLNQKKDIRFEREHLASIYFSYFQNRDLVNEKTRYLYFAQIWFRNSVFTLVTLIAISVLQR